MGEGPAGKPQFIHRVDVAASEGHQAPTCRLEGAASSKFLAPHDYSLWLVASELAAGAALAWDAEHGDEIVYVESGTLEVDGRTCGPRGVVVIESRAVATIASAEPTSLLHFGQRVVDPPDDGPYGPPSPEGHGVHVVGPRGIWEAVDDVRESRYYADAQCPTCRVTLLYTSRTCAYKADVHSHTEDELMYVVKGEMRIGPSVATPGTAIAIPAGRRYGFRSPEAGYGFLNFRPDMASVVLERDSPGWPETGPNLGMTRVEDHVA